MVKHLLRKIILWAFPEFVSLTVSINVDKKSYSTLRKEIEQTVIDLLRRYN